MNSNIYINIDTNTNIKSIINPNTLSANTSSKINKHSITSSNAEIHIHIKTSTNAILVLVLILIPRLILIPIHICILTLILIKFLIFILKVKPHAILILILTIIPILMLIFICIHTYTTYFSDINTNADIITINSTIQNPAPVIDMTMRKLLR